MNRRQIIPTLGVLSRIVALGLTFAAGIVVTAILASILSAWSEPVAIKTNLVVPLATAETATVGMNVPPVMREIPSLQLPRGRTLVTRGNQVYMMNARNEIEWQWSAGLDNQVTDQPYLDVHSMTLYVVGDHMLHVALDAVTGEEKWGGTMTGNASYKQIEGYADGQYLILADMSANDGEKNVYSAQNILIVYKDHEVIQSIEFPREAELLVRDGKVYAVIYSDGGLEMQEVQIPPEGDLECSC